MIESLEGSRPGNEAGMALIEETYLVSLKVSVSSFP